MKQKAESELKIRALRQEHDRVKTGLQRHLERLSSGGGGGGVSSSRRALGAGGGNGIVSGRMGAARGSSSGGGGGGRGSQPAQVCGVLYVCRLLAC